MTAPILLHAANQWLTAISTKPPCTQLTPSSAERARRERRHPKASTAKKSLALDPLENNIDVKRTSADCNADVGANQKPIAGTVPIHPPSTVSSA